MDLLQTRKAVKKFADTISGEGTDAPEFYFNHETGVVHIDCSEDCIEDLDPEKSEFEKIEGVSSVVVTIGEYPDGYDPYEGEFNHWEYISHGTEGRWALKANPFEPPEEW